jgi:hypothetical protein
MESHQKSMVPNHQADLVGGIPTPLKNISVSWDDLLFPTEWKVIIQPSLKPPTRFSGY